MKRVEAERRAEARASEDRGGSERRGSFGSKFNWAVQGSRPAFFLLLLIPEGRLCILSNHPAARGSPEGGAACEVLSSGSERPQ